MSKNIAKGKGVGILLLLFLTLAWGCSSSDDDDKKQEESPYAINSTFTAQQEIPKWEVDMNDNQQPPQWTSPNPAQYENMMIVMVRLQEELIPYSTDDDMMAVLVNGECRALSKRDGNAQKIFFVLNVHGNSSDHSEDFLLCYYSGGLRQLFELNAPNNSYFNERTLGIDSDFSPMFTTGSTKYPIKTMLTVDPGLIDKKAIDTEYDLVGVFVNGECRGMGSPSNAFTVFSYNAEEQGELRYFSWMEEGIFTAKEKLTLNGESQHLTFDF